MIATLAVLLVAAIGLIVWLAFRPETAPTPKAPPKPKPVAPHAPVQPTQRPRPVAVAPAEIETNSPPVKQGGGEAPAQTEERETFKLEVEVFGGNGVAAPGATVVLLDPFAQHSGAARPSELARAKADENGRAKFEVVGRVLRVHAWLGNEAGSSDKFRASETRTRVAVRMSSAVTPHGRVVESGGAPVEGADVRLIATEWFEDPFGLILATKSAADGSFELPPIPLAAFDGAHPDAFAIEAQAKGWPRARVAITADTLRAGDVVVTLERGAFVRGRLVRPDGTSVSGETVLLTSGASSIYSDAEGRFELPLPRSGGVVIARSEYHPSAHGTSYGGTGGWGAPKLLGTFRGDGGDVDLGDVTIGPGQPVKGVLVDVDDKPVKAGDVVLYLAGVQVAAVQTDDAGKFEIPGVGDDPHVLQAMEPPGENAWTGRRHTSVDGVRGGTTDLRVVITGALSVLVKFLAEADRSPVVVPEVTLRATATGATPKGYGWTWAGSRIDSVRFDVDHEGTYDVTVELPGYEPATAPAVPVSPDREFTIDVLFRKKP